MYSIPNGELLLVPLGDDKAPVIALMAAIDALVASGDMPNITIKLFLDGEEERGSPTLAGVLAEVASDVEADLLLFCDGPMHQSGRRSASAWGAWQHDSPISQLTALTGPSIRVIMAIGRRTPARR